MDSLYVRNMSSTEQIELKKKQKNLEGALGILRIDGNKFYDNLRKGPDEVFSVMYHCIKLLNICMCIK